MDGVVVRAKEGIWHRVEANMERRYAQFVFGNMSMESAVRS